MIYTFKDSIMAAVERFKPLSDEKPDLIPTGIKVVDRELGGLEPGTLLILGAPTNIGKSRVKLASMKVTSKTHPVGDLSLEDSDGVQGVRLLADLTGIDSRKIRRGDLSEWEKDKLGEALEEIPEDANFMTNYAVGASLPLVLERIGELTDAGCKLVWVDYLQKIKGNSGDRRNDIGLSLTSIQAKCAEGGAACALISQVRRDVPEGKIPPISALKENGDIENEARIIIMLADAGGGNVKGRISKSAYGGNGTMIMWETQPSGSLLEVDYNTSADGDF